MNAGLSAYAAIYNNFLVNNLHITAQALGGLESLREVPGFLTVAMAAVTVQFRASRLAAFSLLLMGLGLAAISGAHSWLYLVAAGWVWSIGFHRFPANVPHPRQHDRYLPGGRPRQGRVGRHAS